MPRGWAVGMDILFRLSEKGIDKRDTPVLSGDSYGERGSLRDGRRQPDRYHLAVLVSQVNVRAVITGITSEVPSITLEVPAAAKVSV